MAGITPEKEREIREWQKRTGGGCVDNRETQEEAITRTDAELQILYAQIRQIRKRYGRKDKKKSD